MELIANILLGGGAAGAGFFCYVLARRLTAFATLETGMGGAIAVLSSQVDDMTKVLEGAQAAAQNSSQSLGDLTLSAEDAARRLELLLASLHDLPEPGSPAVRRFRVMHRGVRSFAEEAA